MSDKNENSKIVSHRFNVKASAHDVFPLLCPTREYDWIEDWSCRLIHSRSGFAEANCVFETNFPGQEKEIWIVNRFEPPRAIEFVKMAADLYVVKYDITLTPNDDVTCETSWTQTLVGLNDAGNEIVENFDVAAYHEKMAMVGKMLNHYLLTGEKLKLAA